MTALTVARDVVAVSVAVAVAVGGGAYLASGGDDRSRLKRTAATEPPRTISFVPQRVIATSMSSDGPNLRADSTDSMRVDFVVPSDRGTSTEPLKMQVDYTESSIKGCSWGVSGAVMGSLDTGLDGGWRPPADSDHIGMIDVPAGQGSDHTVRFQWPQPAEPGQLVQFALERQGTRASDTCQDVTVVDLAVRY